MWGQKYVIVKNKIVPKCQTATFPPVQSQKASLRLIIRSTKVRWANRERSSAAREPFVPNGQIQFAAAATNW